MPHLTLHFAGRHARLAFRTRPVESPTPVWWRSLDLDGRELMIIGDTSDTSPALFSLAAPQRSALVPPSLRTRLAHAADTFDELLLQSLQPVLPAGLYEVALLELWPTFLAPSLRPWGQRRRFCWSQPLMLSDGSELVECVYATRSEQRINPECVDEYTRALAAGASLAGVALSLVDVRRPMGRDLCWTLNHILLDGHHKMMAAALSGQPIQLLSLLNVSASFATRPYTDAVVRERYAFEELALGM